MKSYKLNKTLENSTYPIEQELKRLNKATQASTLKTIISVSTVIFSGIATSVIFENKLYIKVINKVLMWMKDHNYDISLEMIYLYALFLIYVACIGINVIFYICNRLKEQPITMKKSKYGRKKLSEIFHKSIINDIVVGLSFLDKSKVELEKNVQHMYLYEATFYFVQAIKQINQMKIFDDKNRNCNQKLIDEIGHKTLMTTLIVFQNGVKDVIENIPKEASKVTLVEYDELNKIYNNLKIQINLLKCKE